MRLGRVGDLVNILLEDDESISLINVLTVATDKAGVLTKEEEDFGKDLLAELIEAFEE